MESGFFYPLISVLLSLLWVYFSFRYYLYYRNRIEARSDNQVKYRSLIKGAQISLIVSILTFTGSTIYLFNLSETGTIPAITATLTPGEGADLPSPAPSLSPLLLTPSPESSPTAEVIPGVGTAVIGNTNGFGVYVRSEPGLQYEMLTQLPDGSRVEMTGEVQTADGFTWQRVRLEDGRIGWVADNFLIPEP